MNTYLMLVIVSLFVPETLYGAHKTKSRKNKNIVATVTQNACNVQSVSSVVTKTEPISVLPQDSCNKQPVAVDVQKKLAAGHDVLVPQVTVTQLDVVELDSVLHDITTSAQEKKHDDKQGKDRKVKQQPAAPLGFLGSWLAHLNACAAASDIPDPITLTHQANREINLLIQKGDLNQLISKLRLVASNQAISLHPHVLNAALAFVCSRRDAYETSLKRRFQKMLQKMALLENTSTIVNQLLHKSVCEDQKQGDENNKFRAPYLCEQLLQLPPTNGTVIDGKITITKEGNYPVALPEKSDK